MPEWGLSSLLDGNSLKPSYAPYLTFTGAEGNSIITATDTFGRDVAHFVVTKGRDSKSSFEIARLRAPHQVVQPFCTGKTSSLSGTTRLTIHGQSMKITPTWESMQYGRDMKTPLGKMKWRVSPTSWGNTQELWDARGTKLATYKGSCMKKRSSKLEILVPGDEIFLDMVLASWVSMMKCEDKENKQLETVVEVVSGISGS